MAQGTGREPWWKERPERQGGWRVMCVGESILDNVRATKTTDTNSSECLNSYDVIICWASLVSSTFCLLVSVIPLGLHSLWMQIPNLLSCGTTIFFFSLEVRNLHTFLVLCFSSFNFTHLAVAHTFRYVRWVPFTRVGLRLSNTVFIESYLFSMCWGNPFPILFWYFQFYSTAVIDILSLLPCYSCWNCSHVEHWLWAFEKWKPHLLDHLKGHWTIFNPWFSFGPGFRGWFWHHQKMASQ